MSQEKMLKRFYGKIISHNIKVESRENFPTRLLIKTAIKNTSHSNVAGLNIAPKFIPASM
jgi:hypothetical protein